MGAVATLAMISYSARRRHTYADRSPFHVYSPNVTFADRAVALVAPHCDIVERLRLVPPSAQMRGVWFKSIEKQVERSGRMAAYREYFPTDHYTALAYYPVAELLMRSACAGAIVASPERVHEGMSAITKENAEAFMGTLLGRAMLRVLSRDPVRLLEQALAARRQSCKYGHWELRRHSEREVEMVYTDEYWWIKSAVAGAAQGTFEACGIKAEIETKLIDRFNGSTFFRW